MLTLFASPKPYLGPIDMIQRNALASWLRLRPQCQILLFGDETGTADAARDFGVLHVPEVARNEFGTPLLNDVFEKAEQMAEHDCMCYVNSDIIFLNDIIPATDRVRQHTKEFLIVGQCWNLDLGHPLDFERSDWDECLRGLVKQEGQARGPWAIDYFMFPRGFYKQIPPFALGRAYFDNWLIWKAISQKAPVVDLTPFAMAIHQNHDYGHVAGGQQGAYRGAEAIHNTNLGGGISRRYCILDATHYLDASGLKRNVLNKIRWSMLKIWKKRLWYLLLDSTRPLRHSLGIRSDIFRRLKSLVTGKRRTVDNSEVDTKPFREE